MESVTQTKGTCKGSSTQAATRGAVARPTPKTIGELLQNVPVLAAARRRRRPRKRSRSFSTWKRLRLWTVIAERPGITTADAGLLANVSRRQAWAALSAIEGRGWISSEKLGRSHQARWTVTPAGLRALWDALSRRCVVLPMGYTVGGIPHRQNDTAMNGVLSVVVEGLQSTAGRLRKLGWNRSIIDLAIRTHRLDYLVRQLRDVETAPGIRNRGAVLRFRLFDPNAPARRRAGIAFKILRALPMVVRRMFLAETGDLSPGYCLQLAYALRSIHRKGRKVTTGDVSGMAGQLRKRISGMGARRRRGGVVWVAPLAARLLDSILTRISEADGTVRHNAENFDASRSATPRG